MTQTQTQDYWTAQADAVSIWAPEQQAPTRSKWDDFKYGLCAWCEKGIEDKSDLMVTEAQWCVGVHRQGKTYFLQGAPPPVIPPAYGIFLGVLAPSG